MGMCFKSYQMILFCSQACKPLQLNRYLGFEVQNEEEEGARILTWVTRRMTLPLCKRGDPRWRVQEEKQIWKRRGQQMCCFEPAELEVEMRR